MERIIRQLLDSGRSNPLDRRTVAACQPLLSALKRVVSPASIRVDQRISPDTKTQSVKVDLIRLEQALTNLLQNAFQAARARVVVSCEICPDGVRYCFEDDGPGISDDDYPHLFERFFTTKPVGQGTGLGLAVAHAAARDHGGAIEVFHTDSGGARFCLLLPQREDTADA